MSKRPGSCLLLCLAGACVIALGGQPLGAQPKAALATPAESSVTPSRLQGSGEPGKSDAAPPTRAAVSDLQPHKASNGLARLSGPQLGVLAVSILVLYLQWRITRNQRRLNQMIQSLHARLESQFESLALQLHSIDSVHGQHREETDGKFQALWPALDEAQKLFGGVEQQSARLESLGERLLSIEAALKEITRREEQLHGYLKQLGPERRSKSAGSRPAGDGQSEAVRQILPASIQRLIQVCERVCAQLEGATSSDDRETAASIRRHLEAFREFLNQTTDRMLQDSQSVALHGLLLPLDETLRQRYWPRTNQLLQHLADTVGLKLLNTPVGQAFETSIHDVRRNLAGGSGDKVRQVMRGGYADGEGNVLVPARVTIG